MVYQFYIGGRCRGRYLHYSHCNVDVAILITTVERSYHGQPPSPTSVWCVKSSTNNPFTIWYDYYISAVSVWGDIYNKAIAKWGWRWVVATLLWPLLTAYTYLIHPTIPTCPLYNLYITLISIRGQLIGVQRRLYHITWYYDSGWKVTNHRPTSHIK